jgi:ribonuclease P protein component
LTLIALPNGTEKARLGVSASRRLGGAVLRNRAKRLIREVFRRNKPAAGFDLVVIPKPELLEAPLPALEEDFRSALQRHARTFRS